MDKKTYLSILAAVATAAAIALIGFLAAPIAKPLAWALIIGIATMPHHNHLRTKFPEKPGRAAGLMVFATTVCLILPTSFLVITAAVNAPEWYKQVEQLVGSFTQTGTSTLSRLPLYDTVMGLVQNYGFDLAGIGRRVATSGSSFLLNLATEIAKNLFDLFFILAVALFILFFIYRDGERVVATFIDRLAPNPVKIKRYASKIRSITTAVAVGTILTCCTQGVAAGLGYWVAGVPAPVFCGMLTAIAALIPVVGTALIWVPLAALVALNGEYLTALLLSLYCIFFVGLADNAIRPLAIGAASDISVLAIVLGAICGVITMGLLGLILGPVLFSVLMSLWDDAVADIDPDASPANESNSPG